MTCECLTWCRVPEEPNTYGGRFQMSEHHPSCPDYKAEAYTVIEYDGSFCVVPKGQEADFMDVDEGDDPANYKLSTVMLTRDQFDNLPEFMGF